MKKIWMVSICIVILLCGMCAHYGINVRGGGTIASVSAILVDRDNIFININKNDKDAKVEIYHSIDGFVDNTNKTKKLEIESDIIHYFIHHDLNIAEKNHYYTIYTIDKNGKYSSPEYCLTLANGKQAKSVGIYAVDYGKYKIRGPLYKIQNGRFECFFLNGTLIGINNGGRSNFSVNNIIGNSVTQIDIWGKDMKIPFAIYREFYDKSIAALSINQKNDQSIEFVRAYDNEQERVVYDLQENGELNIKFNSTIKEEKYIFRINFIGDDNVKYVKKWTVEGANAIIDENKFDNSEKNYIEEQYNRNDNLVYQHKEEIFNDSYPYEKSRKFLKIKDNTTFNIYHDTLGYQIYNVKGTSDFFYKNCSGEEGFTFGHHWPYKQPVPTISEDFEITIKII